VLRGCDAGEINTLDDATDAVGATVGRRGKSPSFNMGGERMSTGNTRGFFAWGFGCWDFRELGESKTASPPPGLVNTMTAKHSATATTANTTAAAKTSQGTPRKRYMVCVADVDCACTQSQHFGHFPKQ
jgi:hypothetical protein